MKRFFIWLGSSAVMFFLTWGEVALDGLLNPWLKGVGFRWYQLLTSRHGLTLLYLNHTQGFLIAAAIIGALLGLIITAILSWTQTLD